MTMGESYERLFRSDHPAERPRVLIDHEHLSDFAMGDRTLERRFLCLFLEHAPLDLKRMAGATFEEIQHAAHSLRSSASSVGAWHIVEHAERILEAEDRLAGASKNELLEELSRRMEQTLAYIRQIIDHE